MNARSDLLAPGAQPETVTATGDEVTLRLRLLGTTDLHAHLLPYDYYADRGERPYGLARTATLIHAARAEARNALLFDNGDALQGTPMGDITGPSGPGWRGPNPVIAAMNRLGYDAASLGNHEFNFGLDWLERALADAAFPVTCANVVSRKPQGHLPRFVLLHRTFTDEAGDPHALTLGVIGLVPPQIATWDAGHLAGHLHARDMVETAREVVPQARAAGADLVLLLAHTGIDTTPPRPMMENAALPLAALPGVDAIMAGHSHQLFPGPGEGGICAPAADGVDHSAGTLMGRPALMAGANGTHLGVMDLTVHRRAGRWAVAAHRCALRPVAAQAAIPHDTALARSLRGAHVTTLRHMRKPVGRAARRLHSYLALARPDPSVAAINALKRRILARAMAGTAQAGLPILSATPAYRTGGRGGPLNFCDVPEGPISLRHVADLYPFPNRLCGLLVSGAELREWLERAAICFATQAPGTPEAMLRTPGVPGHDFDVIAGLSYHIDLAARPRYDRIGRLRDARNRRIRDLRHEGRAVQADDRFVLATSTYRAQGGGAFARAAKTVPLHIADRPLREQLAEEIARAPLDPPADHADAWRFAPMPGNAVLLDTGPGLRDDPAALEALGAEDLGLTPEGFLRLRIPL